MNARALAVGALLVVALEAPPAHAREACAITVWADESVRLRWPELPERVRDALTARDDVDACARITLTKRADSLIVQVVLADGRATSRALAVVDDVVPVLEALLVEPARTAAPPRAAIAVAPAVAAPLAVQASPEARPSVPDADATGRAPADVGPRSAPSTPSAVRVELAVLTGARIGDGQAGVGVGAVSFLDVGGWLVGFSGRADRYALLANDAATSAVELAVIGGRRIRFGNHGRFALDLVAGPAIALPGTTRYAVQAGSNAPLVEQPVAREDLPRLVFGARLNVGASAIFRWFVSVDGNISSRIFDDSQSGAPGLPLWTVGLGLGATVGTR